ncbi:sensor histidine kinase [Thermohalobacter berrensis]|uniref:Histidine kinase/HSP90-like ATPase domain-containing protein n=1 Tax=Thermohalobacter berrensis TaxID=99594 RepID=A0A419T5A9_9FIRM|nr:PocR ligand-binding domain-containing protein [Thermohalobacter berrensis]RKD32747.1 hypothetical protein BET03_10460 [Thermohalobacter berrensis]
MDNLILLSDIIDIEILQEIQNQFAQATGLAAVTVDYKGNPMTKYSNFSKFCKLLRNDNKCREACYQSDAHGGLEAARTGKPYIYRCHSGLIDIAVPIIAKGQYLGSFLAGQVKTEKDKLESLDIVGKETNSWKNKEEIFKAYDEIVEIPYDKLNAAAQMMFLVSNYIVEEGMLNYIQQELNKKNMKLMEEMKAKSKLEKSIKDLEIKVLKTQINTHFLFNALNVIGRLALMEHAIKTQEIVYSLSDILRYTLKNNEEMVSIDKELEYIEKYLKIQLVRFGDKIDYLIDVSDEIRSIKIPSMILQPFVENSLIHGLEPKEGKGYVKIKGYSIEKHARIIISDNGVGISEQKLQNLMSENMNRNGNSSLNGIGISNANKRMIHYFGPDYKIKIKSKINEGTTVELLIPKERGE